jgi:hypothetical protein
MGERLNTVNNVGNPVWENFGKDKEKEKEVSKERLEKIFRSFANGEILGDNDSKILLDNWSKYYKSEPRKVVQRGLAKDYAEERPDIYNPSQESIKEVTGPYLEKIRNDFEPICNLGKELQDGGNAKEIIPKMVEYFAGKYELDDVPDVAVIKKKNAKNGFYSSEYDLIVIAVDRTAASIMGTVAHEVWHAKQAQSKDQKYVDNNEFYCKFDVDPEIYSKQVKEAEAHEIGNGVSTMFRREMLNDYPELVSAFRKMYYKSIFGGHKPSREEQQYINLVRNEFQHVAQTRIVESTAQAFRTIRNVLKLGSAS